MSRLIAALLIATLGLVTGCPTSTPPGKADVPTAADAAPEELVGQDAPGPDTVIPEDTLPPTDTLPPMDTPSPDTPDPCAGVDCLATCATDADCDMGHVCVPHHDGCCSDCVPFCELCYMSEGTWCPAAPPDDLCELGLITTTEVGPCWFEVEYEGVDGTDVLFMDGCMDHVENLPVNGCSLSYDDDTDSFEVACNWCGPLPYTQAACDTAMTELTALCVHAPNVVGAGGPFPIAVYGQTGCATFHHAEVQQDGFDVEVTLWGLVDPLNPCEDHDECGPGTWIYTGLVWADAPNPGAYDVIVGGGHHATVGASGGIIGDPVCQDDCAWPELETYAWTLDHLTSDEAQGLCFGPGAPTVVGTDMTISGACQDYLFIGEDWFDSGDAFYCNDGELLFGAGPPYQMEGTVCDTNVLGINDAIMVLGIHHGWTDPSGDTTLFVLRGMQL